MAEQRQRREHAAALQAHNRAVREADRAQREYERAVAAADRAATHAQNVARTEALKAHQRAQREYAESLTAQALEAFEEIDSILAATLSVDDYVDIDALKQTVSHPPFPREELKKPAPQPRLDKPPAEPAFVAPPPPTGMAKVFGKKAHAEATSAAHAAWQAEHQAWSHYVQRVLPAKNAELLKKHAAAEKHRDEMLTAALAEYRRECDERERQVAQTNADLDTFKRAFQSGDPDALVQYVGLILSNSAYPEIFQVDFEYEFDPELGELTVAVIVPPPSAVPKVKAFKYVPASDEIRETACTQKEQKDRYNGAVAAVAIRTFHEVFEGDREGRINTISLTVQTETSNPATGLDDTFPFVAAAADRHEFIRYDLRNVDPSQTLELMHAAVSKNAFALKPISTARGIR